MQLINAYLTLLAARARTKVLAVDNYAMQKVYTGENYNILRKVRITIVMLNAYMLLLICPS